VPMCLLLSQLALWYQARPLRVGEEAVLTVQLAGASWEELPEVRFESTACAATTIGPVRVPSKRMICWNLQAKEDGYHRLVLNVDGQNVEKELAVGDGFMRVSLKKPGNNWFETVLHPLEPPFPQDSIIQGIEIDYPDRNGWASGSGSWLIFWFLVSIVAAFCVRPWLKVNM